LVGQTGECVYNNPRHNCSSTYIGETGRLEAIKRTRRAHNEGRIYQQQNIYTNI